MRAAEPRVLVRPDGVHRRRPDAPDRPGGGLRAGAVGADVPHPAGGGRQGQQHALRPVRRRLDRQGVAHPLDGRPAARGRGVGQHVQPVRPDVAVRRLQGVRLRPRGRPARPRGLRDDGSTPSEPDGHPQGREHAASTSARPTSSTSAAPSRAASRAGPTSSADAKGRSSPTPPRASRKDARDAVVAARGAFAGWAGATAYNRGQVLYRVAEVMEGRRAQFVDEVVAGRGPHRRRGRAAGRRAAIDRWVWYAGLDRQARAGARRAEPRRGAVLRHLRARADRRRRRRWRRSSRRCSGWSRVVAPVVVTGNTAVVVASERRPLPAVTLVGGPRDVGRAGRGRQHPHRPRRRDRPLARLAPRRQRDRPRRCGRGRRRRLGRPGARRGRQPQARAPPGRRGHRRGRAGLDPHPGPARVRAFLETKTVWHPKGR